MFKERKIYPGACKYVYHWHNLFTFELYCFEPYHRKIEKKRKHYPYFHFTVRTYGSLNNDGVIYTTDDPYKNDDGIEIIHSPYNNSMDNVKKLIFEECVKIARLKLKDILDYENT